MPPGSRSGQAGNAVPLSGESEIRAESSGNDMLTLTGHSSQAGDFLVLRANAAEGSTVTAGEKFVVGSSGELRRFEYLVGAAVASGTTAVTLGTTDSGKVLLVGAQAEGLRVSLPAPQPGLNFTFVQEAGGASNGVRISATAAGAYQILYPSGATGPTTAAVASPSATRAGLALSLIAISTVTWQAFPYIHGVAGTSATAEVGGFWVAGTS